MDLVDRVRDHLPAAEEKRMFGGTGFMVDGALACSAGDAALNEWLDREVAAARASVSPAP